MEAPPTTPAVVPVAPITPATPTPSSAAPYAQASASGGDTYIMKTPITRQILYMAFVIGGLTGLFAGSYIIKQVLLKKKDVVIHKATYGSDQRVLDVTGFVQEQVDVNGPIDVFQGALLTDVLGDPAFGAVKKLKIDYSVIGEEVPKHIEVVDANPGPRIVLN